MPDEPSVPLAHYIHERQGVGVRFTCCVCEAAHDVPVAQVVARLQARGLDGEQTGVREVARFAERACARCGARRWETRPAWALPE